MPKESRVRPAGRARVHPQESWRVTTPARRPVARPTDPYLIPREPTEAEQFLGILRSTEQGINAGADAIRAEQRKNTEEATQDFRTGKPAKEGASDSYMKAYDELSGLSRATEYATDLIGLVNAADEQTPTEFVENAGKLRAKYTAGMTEEELAAFNRKAHPMYQRALAQYEHKQLLRTREHLKDDGAKVMADTYIASQEKVDDPDDEYSTVDQAQDLRKQLTALQDKFRKAGIGRKEATLFMARHIGNLGIEEGDPDALEFLKLKENGVAPIDNPEIFEFYQDWQEDFRQSEDQREARERAGVSERRDELATDILYDLMSAWQDPELSKEDKMVELRKLRNRMEEHKDILGYTRSSQLLDLYDKAITNTSVGTSDPELKQSLILDIVDSAPGERSVTSDQIIKAVNSGDLSAADGLYLLDLQRKVMSTGWKDSYEFKKSLWDIEEVLGSSTAGFDFLGFSTQNQNPILKKAKEEFILRALEQDDPAKLFTLRDEIIKKYQKEFTAGTAPLTPEELTLAESICKQGVQNGWSPEEIQMRLAAALNRPFVRLAAIKAQLENMEQQKEKDVQEHKDKQPGVLNTTWDYWSTRVPEWVRDLKSAEGWLAYDPNTPTAPFPEQHYMEGLKQVFRGTQGASEGEKEFIQRVESLRGADPVRFFDEMFTIGPMLWEGLQENVGYDARKALQAYDQLFAIAPILLQGPKKD